MMKLLKLYILPIVMMILLVFVMLNSRPTNLKPRKNITEINDTIRPEMKVENAYKDFGMVKKDSPVEVAFRVINKGKAPLIIYKVNASCGCTVVDWDHTPVLPHDTTVVNVKYDSSIPGHFVKKIFILSNAKNSPTLLIIRGEIIL